MPAGVLATTIARVSAAGRNSGRGAD